MHSHFESKKKKKIVLLFKFAPPLICQSKQCLRPADHAKAGDHVIGPECLSEQEIQQYIFFLTSGENAQNDQNAQ